MKWLGGLKWEFLKGAGTPGMMVPLVRAELNTFVFLLKRLRDGERFNLFQITVKDNHEMDWVTDTVTKLSKYSPEKRARHFLKFFRRSSQSFGSGSASEWKSGSGSASKSKAGSEFESASTSTFRRCGGSKVSNRGPGLSYWRLGGSKYNRAMEGL